MTYRLVLDASAVAAYAAGSIHLGEVLAEAADEPDVLVAVPSQVLVDVVAAGADPAMLLPLATLHHVDVVDHGWSWMRLGLAAQLLGGVDRALAALMVDAGQAAFVVTADPDGYPGIETIAI